MRFAISLLAMFLLTFPVLGQTPKRILLLATGPDGHPAGTHEYEKGLKILRAELGKHRTLEATLVRADDPWRDGPEKLATADGVVLFLTEGAKWLSHDAKRLSAFQDLAKRKGGLTVLHWGMGTKDAKNIDAFVQLFGACHGGPDRKYQVVHETLEPVAKDHPIVRGVGPIKVREEFYYHLKQPKSGPPITPLLKVRIDGEMQTVGWSWQRADGGRSFGFSGLHFHENLDLPEYRRLVTQGILWTVDGDR